MKIISCCLREVENADNVIKVSYISAFDSQGRCLKKKKKDHFLLSFTSALDDGSMRIRSQGMKGPLQRDLICPFYAYKRKPSIWFLL